MLATGEVLLYRVLASKEKKIVYIYKIKVDIGKTSGLICIQFV